MHPWPRTSAVEPMLPMMLFFVTATAVPVVQAPAEVQPPPPAAVAALVALL